MGRRKTCSYCKAVKMNYDEGNCTSNDNYQVGCLLGYKQVIGPAYVGRGKKDAYIGDRYPVEKCPKPTTWMEYNYLMYQRTRGSASGEIRNYEV